MRKLNARTSAGHVIACLTLLAISTATIAESQAPRHTLPARLSDADFWKLAGDMSEPGGYFRIEDNFTSNEPEIGQLMASLRARGATGGVYMGVGPEQNFSYMAALRPDMAFIVDIRRQAAMQHLMFKAVFELSRDRADFLSLLFSKPRPAGLDSTTAIDKIWDAFWYVPTDTVQGPRNYQRVLDHLTKTHGFTFTADETAMIKWVWDSFYYHGPVISTRGAPGGGGANGNGSTFADLTGYSRDQTGQTQSFLSTEDNYRFLKSLHEKNLIVPLTGDFAGPKAVRAVGAYLTAHGATLNAFYVSNVEQYLFQDGKNRAFYANLTTVPVSDTSVIIRPFSIPRNQTYVLSLCPAKAFVAATQAGRVGNYNAALACTRSAGTDR